jgi:uncharacterized protein
VRNHVCAAGSYVRTAGIALVDGLITEHCVEIVPIIHELFAAELDLYRRRLDKSWSITDCASMVVCERDGVRDVLTYDRHFEQAGYRCLRRDAAPGEA